MAEITDYASLQAAIASHANRSDLTSVLPLLVQLGEGTLWRDIRVRDVTCRGTFTITADGDGLPDDYRELDSWYHDGPTYYGPIDIVGGDEIPALKLRYGVTGVPRAAVIADERFYYAPEPDTTYETKMIYWRRIIRLSDSNTTNWLLLEHPDIYLYACLGEVEPFLKNDPRVALWRSRLEDMIEELYQDTKTRRVSSPVRRPRMVIG